MDKHNKSDPINTSNTDSCILLKIMMKSKKSAALDIRIVIKEEDINNRTLLISILQNSKMFGKKSLKMLKVNFSLMTILCSLVLCIKIYSLRIGGPPFGLSAVIPTPRSPQST
eukprot:TRINITY_DN9374_c0_g1_i2.p2 TRINITY_DN9374_c0_g1~~TRINITY_DN9374_c0_g1_i2.p2  ORF type:complete len:113 (+),score=2.62 TRINITY_DN9374_c0_g1_i2:593-931(+)